LGIQCQNEAAHANIDIEANGLNIGIEVGTLKATLSLAAIADGPTAQREALKPLCSGEAPSEGLSKPALARMLIHLVPGLRAAIGCGQAAAQRPIFRVSCPRHG